MLRWPPDALWRATPRELAAAARGLGLLAPATPLGRADLAALMARYPDGGP